MKYTHFVYYIRLLLNNTDNLIIRANSSVDFDADEPYLLYRQAQSHQLARGSALSGFCLALKEIFRPLNLHDNLMKRSKALGLLKAQ